MSTITDEERERRQEEVRNFLGARKAEKKADPIPLTEEPDKPEEEVVPRATVFEPSPISNPAGNSIHNVKSIWEQVTEDLGKIEVDDEDKSLYMKAMLHDIPVSLVIPLLNNKFMVTVKSMSNFEQKLLFHAARIDEKSKTAVGLSELVTHLQYYQAILMTQEINGVPTKNPKFEYPFPSLDEAAEILSKTREEWMESMNVVKWHVVLTALRVFEVKIKLCNDSLLNRDFWKPVGIG